MKFAKRVESESSSAVTFLKKGEKTNKTIHSRDIEERKIDLSGESNSISYLLSFIFLSLSLSLSDQISRTEFLVTFLICLDRRAISSVES